MSIFYYAVKFLEQRSLLMPSEDKSSEHEIPYLTQEQRDQVMIQIQFLTQLIQGRNPPAHGVHCMQNYKKKLISGDINEEQQKNLVKKCLEGLPTRLHASDFLSKKLRRPTVYYPLSSKLVLEEHDRILQYEKEARIHWVDTCISTLKAQNKPVPLRLQTEHNALSLIELQKRVRAEVVGTMPEDALNGRNFRNKKEIAKQQKAREKQATKQKIEAEKKKKKQRQNFLATVLQHQKNFAAVHREHRSRLKKSAKLAKDWLADRQKQEEEKAKQEERKRLLALKNQDEEGYYRLLQTTKNQRLQQLLKQTEQYMDKLGATIQAEQLQKAAAERKKDKDLRRENGEDVSDDEEDEVKSASTKTAEQKHVQDSSGDLGDTYKSRQRYYQIAHAIKESVLKQPAALAAGNLRKYQMAGLEWLVSLYNNNLNGILADEMGLGKTVQTVSLLAYLMEHKNCNGPFLVIVPMSTLHNNWEYEFERWLPSCKKVVYDGDPEHRKMLRQKYLTRNGEDYNALLTTFEFAMRDKTHLKSIHWEYIIVDEAHRLKNPKCKLSADLGQYHRLSRRVALTGTPLQNELPELWSLLNFLHPAIFDSCENFERWFASPFANLNVGAQQATQMTEEEKLLVMDRLHAMLRPFVLRREKSQVETQLMDKVEKVLRCKLTPVQQVLYSGVVENKISVQNRVMQLRKICNHPYLFHPYTRGVAGSSSYRIDDYLVNICGKFIVLDNVLPKLKACGHRVLIFNQMTKVMSIMQQYFDHKGYKYLRLDGNTSAEVRAQSLQDYNRADSPYFIFMLSTKAGGLGLNLQSADTVILFDSDWNPQNDLQAQARAHRIGQKKQVIVLRFVTSGTVEEKILSTAHDKLDAEAMVIKAGMFHKEYKQTESKQLLTDVMDKKGAHREDDEIEATEADVITRAIARDEQELKLYREMDAARAEKEKLNPNDSNRIPRWLVDYCKFSNRAQECSEEWVELDINSNLDHFYHSKESHEPILVEDRNGRMRRPRTEANYVELTDREFNKKLRSMESGSDEEEPSPTNQKVEPEPESVLPQPVTPSPPISKQLASKKSASSKKTISKKSKTSATKKSSKKQKVVSDSSSSESDDSNSDSDSTDSDSNSGSSSSSSSSDESDDDKIITKTKKKKSKPTPKKVASTQKKVNANTKKKPAATRKRSLKKSSKRPSQKDIRQASKYVFKISGEHKACLDHDAPPTTTTKNSTNSKKRPLEDAKIEHSDNHEPAAKRQTLPFTVQDNLRETAQASGVERLQTSAPLIGMMPEPEPPSGDEDVDIC
eukprot:CAMPEP_0175134196 /NCGR_PEP_ID=MMETSP0087-20121206/8054_1 /TAXON_ID=136419 /ORGANISM="Unknown Unknown, Strain D1" /LENGTH=1286 /DNA_ID=CAMNT_0016416751 /DNA_START=229 /DNA_END=4089 /DNA_ORIENTATION=-